VAYPFVVSASTVVSCMWQVHPYSPPAFGEPICWWSWRAAPTMPLLTGLHNSMWFTTSAVRTVRRKLCFQAGVPKCYLRSSTHAVRIIRIVVLPVQHAARITDLVIACQLVLPCLMTGRWTQSPSG
jgi:hypothetical protein